jgi:cell division transport system permease protein
MLMKENKEVKISYWAAHFTTIVSVALVLLLVALISLIWMCADTETRRLKERLELTVIMADSIPDASAAALAEQIAAKPYTAQAKVVTKAEALKNWTAETGEDLEQLFGVNPLSPEVNFTVKAEYASTANLAQIKSNIERMPGVESVDAPEAAMVDAMNGNIARLTVVLAAIAVIMLIISFVLINNTVHLTIYSRRFSIHTMQLVGATDGFIRRPVIVNNMLSGLVAGVVAMALVAIGIVTAKETGYVDIISYVGWDMFGVIAAAVILLGMAMCSLAAWIASSRYLHKKYDELFR